MLQAQQVVLTTFPIARFRISDITAAVIHANTCHMPDSAELPAVCHASRDKNSNFNSNAIDCSQSVE